MLFFSANFVFLFTLVVQLITGDKKKEKNRALHFSHSEGNCWGARKKKEDLHYIYHKFTWHKKKGRGGGGEKKKEKENSRHQLTPPAGPESREEEGGGRGERKYSFSLTR